MSLSIQSFSSFFLTSCSLSSLTSHNPTPHHLLYHQPIYNFTFWPLRLSPVSVFRNNRDHSITTNLRPVTLNPLLRWTTSSYGSKREVSLFVLGSPSSCWSPFFRDLDCRNPIFDYRPLEPDLFSTEPPSGPMTEVSTPRCPRSLLRLHETHEVSRHDLVHPHWPTGP